VLGMAEGLLCFTRLDDRPDLLLHTQGRPLSADDEVRIVDEQGQPVPEGEVGELQVRGPYTIRGYYRLPEHNARAFTADGFYCSGDRVRRTAGVTWWSKVVTRTRSTAAVKKSLPKKWKTC